MAPQFQRVGPIQFRIGTITNNSVITLSTTSGTNADLHLSTGDVTLTGTGALTMSSTGPASARIFADNGNWRLTNDVNHTINGFGNIGVGNTHLTNNGLIDANALGQDADRPGQRCSKHRHPAGKWRRNPADHGWNHEFPGLTNGTIQALNSLPTPSAVLLSNATIAGGVLATTGNGVITNAGPAAFDGITNTGALSLNESGPSSFQMGTITNKSVITLSTSSGNDANLHLSTGDVTLTGTGTLTMSSTGPASAQIFADNGNWLLTNDVNHTINGFGNIGIGHTHLTNNGLIDAQCVG